MSIIKLKIPKAFQFLFEDYRYKVAYGGRGSGKSWTIARVLILKAMEGKHRILCSRELQNSISDSVHQLLRDQITELDARHCFDITNKEITCNVTGSQFKFKGLHHNIDEIKSFEGVTICWVEEAEKVSEDSWKKLIPTIFRRANAELWISFNTGYEDDPTYERFVKNPPKKSITKLINYDSNPFFPKVLNEVRLEDKKYRPLEYKNIWEGAPKGYGGKVWPMFRQKEAPLGHVKMFDWEHVEKTANIVMACDPAQKYYHACIWIAIFPINKRMQWPNDFVKWVYAEYPDFETFGDYFYRHRKRTLYTHGLKTFANTIKSKDSSGHRLECTKRFIDTRFATGTGGGNVWSSQTVGLVEEFAKPANGSILFELPPIKFIDSAKHAIESDLKYDFNLPISQINTPSFFVSPACKNVIHTLFNHRVEENSETETEKLKDFSDCLKIAYAGLREFKYKKPVNVTDNHTYEGMYQMFNNPSSWMG